MSSPLPVSVPAPVQEYVRKMSPARRFAALGLLLGALALLWVATSWATAPTYVTLYKDLELNTAGSIRDALTKNNIEHRLANGGAEILVPAADVARARVLLAKDNLPGTAKPGLELFDKQTWGMTDFSQRVTYRRALEGELARTIGSLRGVAKASVHLALPESSPLRRLERPAEAAVVITLQPGVTLGDPEVQGIAQLVSNSVEQLPSENVAVMDDSGKLLTLSNDASGVALSTRQLDLQRGVERELAGKAETFLSTVLGANRSRVQVAARLNFEQVERTTEQFDPDGSVLQTEQRSESGADGGDGSTAGAQTIISNQYNNSKKVERVIGATGTIGRLTVAVLVDEKTVKGEAQKSGQTVEAQLAGLETAVRNAIGIDTTRGDRLTLAAMSFDADPLGVKQVQKADSTAGKKDVLVLVERFSRPGILLIGVLLAFVIAWRLLKPPAPPPAPAATLAAGTPALPAGEGRATAAEDDDAAPALPPEDSGPRVLPPLPKANAKSLQLRATVQAESENRPDVAAQVMRAWMTEAR